MLRYAGYALVFFSVLSVSDVLNRDEVNVPKVALVFVVLAVGVLLSRFGERIDARGRSTQPESPASDRPQMAAFTKLGDAEVEGGKGAP